MGVLPQDKLYIHRDISKDIFTVEEDKESNFTWLNY